MNMITVGNIYDGLDAIAPFAAAEPWDNSGLLVGSPDMPVRRILFALDVTRAVLEEANKLSCQLIISHHPVIFEPLKSLSAEHIVYRLAVSGICVISTHTNLDIAKGGVNDALAEAIGLSGLKPLHVLENGSTIGYAGNLQTQMNPADFAQLVKDRLCAGGVRAVSGRGDISAVAVCGGSGAKYLGDAKRLGTQAMVTGEVLHHLWLLAEELGITLVEAGHFATENVVLAPLMKKMRERFPSVELVMSKAGTDGVRYV